MEIIIGREEGARRLHCIADGREFNIGQAGCVPTSVSRKHSKIIIRGKAMTIENMKPQNVTFVDGGQIFSKEITAASKIQLGNERYTVPLQEVLNLATGKSNARVADLKSTVAEKKSEPPTFSLLPLKNVWEEYDMEKLKIQEDAAKKANQQRIQGIVSMCGMALGIIPIPFFREACVFISLCMAVYFFVKGSKSNSVQRKLHDLDEKYAKKYKCPNPECGKPFGGVPYRQIEYNKQCFACGCKYTH